MCYSIYLMHNLVTSATAIVWAPYLPERFASGAVLSCVVMLSLVLLVSAAYFRLVERPCMRRDWPRKVREWFVGRLFVKEQAPQADA